MALKLRFHGAELPGDGILERIREALTLTVYSQKAFAEFLFQEELNVSCDLTFLNRERMRELNREHREIDRTTDVLSFPMLVFAAGELREEILFYHLEDPENNPDDPEADVAEFPTLFLGDLLICPDIAREQATQYGHSFEREIVFLAVHGMLHILGYDHMEPEEESRMRQMQNFVMQKIKLER